MKEELTMPIPVLIGLGLGVAAGVTGVVKAVGAKQKNDQAQDVNAVSYTHLTLPTT